MAVLFYCYVYNIFFIALSVYRYIDFVRFNEKARLRQDFLNELNQSVINYGKINFDTITTFEWDALLIIFPYTDPKLVFEEKGLEWRRLRAGIRDLSEGTLVIFLNDNHIVHYFTSTRNLMCRHAISSGDGPMFNREDAIFYPCPHGGFNNNICLIPYVVKAPQV